MSDWFYVAAGWIITYVAMGAWFYTSRTKKIEK